MVAWQRLHISITTVKWARPDAIRIRAGEGTATTSADLGRRETFESAHGRFVNRVAIVVIWHGQVLVFGQDRCVANVTYGPALLGRCKSSPYRGRLPLDSHPVLQLSPL